MSNKNQINENLQKEKKTQILEWLLYGHNLMKMKFRKKFHEYGIFQHTNIDALNSINYWKIENKYEIFNVNKWNWWYDNLKLNVKRTFSNLAHI